MVAVFEFVELTYYLERKCFASALKHVIEILTSGFKDQDPRILPKVLSEAKDISRSGQVEQSREVLVWLESFLIQLKFTAMQKPREESFNSKGDDRSTAVLVRDNAELQQTLCAVVRGIQLLQICLLVMQDTAKIHHSPAVVIDKEYFLRAILTVLCLTLKWSQQGAKDR